MARAAKRTVAMTTRTLSKRIAGRVVERLEETPSGSLAIRFEDGGSLTIERREGGVAAVLQDRTPPEVDGPRPTRRQLEYLEFIRRYLHRYGMSPAESDIQTHFMVSAPSVNQMVRTLERRGFITRDRDWFGQTIPRSIRVLWDE